DGVVSTPTLRAALPGITREVLFEVLPREGRAIVERDIDVFELHTADEVFIASAIFLGVPIIEIDGRTVGSGSIGPVTEEVGEVLFREMAAAAPLKVST